MSPQYQHPPTGLNQYTVREPSVAEFLAQRPALEAYLVETYSQLRNYFPEETFALDMVYDPNDPTDEAVFVYIETTQPMDDAMDVLEAFRQAWWLDHLRPFAGQIGIDLDFV